MTICLCVMGGEWYEYRCHKGKVYYYRICHSPSLHHGRDRHSVTIAGLEQTLDMAYLTQRKITITLIKVRELN